MSRETSIFVNEAARRGHSPQTVQTIELLAERLNAEVHTTATRSADELRNWLLPRAPSDGTCVVVGGDGTLSVALNVLAGRDVAVGYVPAGFGNAAAYLLRLPRDPRRLAALIAMGKTRPVDLMKVDGRLCLFAGAGWDAVVARHYANGGARGLLGWTAAVVAALPELRRRRRVELTVDGTIVYRGALQLLVAGTTPYYGRGLLVNPGAHPAAGRLTVRCYPGPAPALAAEALRWMLHRLPRAPAHHGGVAELRVVAGRPLQVQADGDVIGERRALRFEIAPAAVRLIGRWD